MMDDTDDMNDTDMIAEMNCCLELELRFQSC